MRALSRFCPAGLCLALLACWLSLAPASAETRVALVIGNGAYASTAKLPNPSHDAEDVAASLKRSGFEVLQGIDLRQAEMQDLTIRFARAASRADVHVLLQRPCDAVQRRELSDAHRRHAD